MTEATTKSIIDPKYKDKYKTPDWLGGVINKRCTATKTVEVAVLDKEGKKTDKKTTKEVPDGLDIDALKALATENGIDHAPYAKMNVGQLRMNIGNTLRSLTLKRHGLFVDGKWVKADADWLKAKNAPEAPTHAKDGTALAKPKVKEEKAVEGKGNVEAAKERVAAAKKGK